MRRPFVVGLLVSVLSTGLWAGQGQTPPPATPQTPPVFRGGTTLVPVDVRVVDRNNQPVTDLKQHEFVVLENNVRQQLRYFSTQALVAAEPAAGGDATLRRGGETPAIAPQSRRVFLIVLGRGRLQEPAKGVDSIIDLLKNRLLPQDYVGVMAWNRATDFTTDHAKVLGVVERFRKQHENVEALFKQRFSGLAAIYGGSAIPPHLQKAIDAVFNGPDAPGMRELPADPITDARRVADDTRRATDALQRAEAIAGRTNVLTSVGESPESLGLNVSLDEFVELNAQSMQDLNNLYTGVSYLRHVPGEKQLLFVSERGMFLPRTEDDRGLAALAADARVVMNIIHTGGTPPPNMGRGASPPNWQVATSQNVAELTGGQFTSTSMGKAFMERLDTTSRFQYVLGYAPINTVMDGRYRRITVRVTRPGVRVLYRHGYFGRQNLPALDRQRVVSYTRVTSAANYAQDVKDIGLTVTASNVKPAPSTGRQVEVHVVIAPGRLSLTEAADRKKGSIEIAIFCGGEGERLVGQTWNTVEFEMTPEALQRFKEKGLTYSGRVNVAMDARHVKVIVYDSGADLVGSTMLKIK